ncbi:hypothetical protein JXA48_00080 [Candidatus Woesearchaeota archaeon]|nr:hypothetical protein [Candidatus Woesearchaeota archaeon]
MKKNIIIIGLILILSLTLIGCSKNNDEIDPNALSPDLITDDTKSNFNYEEDTGILQDKIMIDKEGFFKGTIQKTKTSKTAQIEFEYYFNDTIESAIFMGEEVIMAPMIINTLCESFPKMFFAENFSDFNSDLNKATGEASNIEDDNAKKIIESLEGYKVTSVKITFLDFETNEKIAECSAKSAENIETKAYRNYDQSKSFLNAKIGN